MFGYLQPDLESITKKDITLLNNYNCSVFNQFKKYGVKVREYQNFDFGFLNFLLHRILKEKSEHKENLCSFSVFNKGQALLNKSQITDDEITIKMAEIAVICFHYGCTKRCKKSDKNLFNIMKQTDKKCFKKVAVLNKQLCSDIENILKKFYKNQRDEVTDLKVYCEPIGRIAERISREFIIKKEVQALFYYTGCRICLMSMIGGLNSDHKNRYYNPLLKQYNFKGDKTEFLHCFGKHIKQVYDYFLNNLQKNYNKIAGIKNNLIKNILITAPEKFREYLD